jgi:hypothetical protein
MKLTKIIVYLAVLLGFGCDNTTNFDNGFCKFAPPESNFPIIERSCEECFFNLRFQDKEYSFLGNRISTGVGGDRSQMINVFLSFYLVPPDSDEELYSSLDTKTPLVKTEVITKSADSLPLVSTAFGIYNYCNDFFEPVTNDVSKSYHRLIKAELIQSYSLGTHQFFFFELTGEINATFIINGEAQLVTSQYKVQSQVYEKL